MKPDLLLDAISNHVKLTKDEEKIVVSLLKDKKVKKKQYLLQEKEIQKYGFCVLSGCLRSYSIAKLLESRKLKLKMSLLYPYKISKLTSKTTILKVKTNHLRLMIER